ncbi:hypothetical protein [Tropicimonas sp. IMCC34043]|uniref:hypothetical protein n=1 Tax=Tropicimonas sp. IMCC34043 TaxID=2248760 RepID=UPI000E26C379|nr:hypothetical protein [Tropicimonas sp. IMCC34043]
MTLVSGVLRAGFGLTACLALQATAVAAPLPKGDGYAELRTECTRCHTLHNIQQSDGFTAEGWQAFIEQMTDIETRPEHRNKIVAYLAEHFPPDP